MTFLDPTNDIAFRKIFGNEQHKEILISFLNSILALPEGRKILNVTLLDRTQAPHLDGLKESIVDVRCKDQKDIQYIVEMQVGNLSGFDKRSLYYASKAYTEQIRRGDEYPKLNQVIFIGIVRGTMFNHEQYLSYHQILNTKTQQQQFNGIELVILELEKFKLELNSTSNIIEKWSYFLKNAKDLQFIPQEMHEPEIKSAFGILDQHDWSLEELDYYDRVGVKITEQKLGLSESYDQGKLESKLETAQKMKEEGLDINLISKITGLNINEITTI